MSPQAHDDELRGAFRRLRERDEQRAGPFASALSAAARRAVVGRPHWHAYRLVATAAALLVAVVLIERIAPNVQPSAATRPSPVSQAPLAQWRAPTDVLLLTSDRELMRSVPRLGAPVGDWKIRATEES